MHSFSELQKLFLNFLAQQNFKRSPSALYQPISYIMELGGKRIRPILLLMAYDMFADDIQEALPAAYAIELFHNFSLVHDDIMDKAPLRRGKDTVHKRFGENNAILSGDAMMIFTYQYLNQPSYKDSLLEIINTFNEVAIGVCEGQQYDMNFEKETEVEIQDYIRMIELKTSVLIAGALKIGALIAKAAATDAQHLYDFGKNIGIAFQLQDDLLDTFGDPDKFGKKLGGDIAQNKKTFLFLKALQISDSSTKKELLSWYNDNAKDRENEKIIRVTSIFKELKIGKETQKLMEEYLNLAFGALEKVNLPPLAKREIKNLSQVLMNREH